MTTYAVVTAALLVLCAALVFAALFIGSQVATAIRLPL